MTHHILTYSQAYVDRLRSEIAQYQFIAGFLFVACLASWVLFIWLWAWNHKPRQSVKVANKPEVRGWKMPSGDHWRN